MWLNDKVFATRIYRIFKIVFLKFLRNIKELGEITYKDQRDKI